jgi:hypothetical protein
MSNFLGNNELIEHHRLYRYFIMAAFEYRQAILELETLGFMEKDEVKNIFRFCYACPRVTVITVFYF